MWKTAVMTAAFPERHIVLVAPEIHWNTGNIGRSCLGASARLHLVEPLGFSLDHKHLKRAGLDYWQRVDLHVWPSFNRFLEVLRPEAEEMALFTKNGANPHWDLPRKKRMFLVFGSETKGLPKTILSAYHRQTYFIPTSDEIRSLNLSTAAGIALFESLRPHKKSHYSDTLL